MQEQNKSYIYVLASPRQDGTIAILCRTNAHNEGPAYCNSKKSAIQLKTKLSNDPRGLANHRALELIQGLYVYRIDAAIEPIWEKNSLWAYLPKDLAECVEGMFNFN